MPIKEVLNLTSKKRKWIFISSLINLAFSVFPLFALIIALRSNQMDIFSTAYIDNTLEVLLFVLMILYLIILFFPTISLILLKLFQDSPRLELFLAIINSVSLFIIGISIIAWAGFLFLDLS